MAKLPNDVAISSEQIISVATTGYKAEVGSNNSIKLSLDRTIKGVGKNIHRFGTVAIYKEIRELKDQIFTVDLKLVDNKLSDAQKSV